MNRTRSQELVGPPEQMLGAGYERPGRSIRPEVDNEEYEGNYDEYPYDMPLDFSEHPDIATEMSDEDQFWDLFQDSESRHRD